MTLEDAISALTLEFDADDDEMAIIEDTLTKLASAQWKEGYAEGTLDTLGEGEEL